MSFHTIGKTIGSALVPMLIEPSIRSIYAILYAF
ncbi:hypothetical protein G9274_000017 [Stenotrophomonas rhizophila]|nr:hypothetical protein G9274_000017 [Stenotrophomonas rhizophila]